MRNNYYAQVIKVCKAREFPGGIVVRIPGFHWELSSRKTCSADKKKKKEKYLRLTQV